MNSTELVIHSLPNAVLTLGNVQCLDEVQLTISQDAVRIHCKVRAIGRGPMSGRSYFYFIGHWSKSSTPVHNGIKTKPSMFNSRFAFFLVCLTKEFSLVAYVTSKKEYDILGSRFSQPSRSDEQYSRV